MHECWLIERKQPSTGCNIPKGKGMREVRFGGHQQDGREDPVGATTRGSGKLKGFRPLNRAGDATTHKRVTVLTV